jgi:hypothetical protein
MEDVYLNVVNTPKGWAAGCSEFINAVTKEFSVFRVHRQMSEYSPKMVVWLAVCCDLMLGGEHDARIAFEQHQELEYTAHLYLPVQLWETFAKGQVAFFRCLEIGLANRLTVSDAVRVCFAHPAQDRHGDGKGIHGAFFVQMLLFGKGIETATGPTPVTGEPMVTCIGCKKCP